MSDLKWQSKNGDIKILVNKDETGFKVQRITEGVSFERWNQWDYFFDTCGLVEQLQSQLEQKDKRIKELEDALAKSE